MPIVLFSKKLSNKNHIPTEGVPTNLFDALLISAIIYFM
jgi:hypothetical protein